MSQLVAFCWVSGICCWDPYLGEAMVHYLRSERVSLVELHCWPCGLKWSTFNQGHLIDSHIGWGYYRTLQSGGVTGRILQVGRAMDGFATAPGQLGLRLCSLSERQCWLDYVRVELHAVLCH